MDDVLEHHGILGQKWGVRRFQNYDGSRITSSKNPNTTKEIPNAKKLEGYSGPAYFISTKKLDGETLKPRIPENFFTKNGYEDSETPRVSFAPSIQKCLAGLSQNVEGNEYYVYEPKDITTLDVYKPNTKAVPDSEITGELWVTTPVELKQVGKIKVTGNDGNPGKSFSYGDSTAELYDDWTYENLDDTFRHDSVKGGVVKDMYSECILKSDTFFDGYAEQKYDDTIVHDDLTHDDMIDVVNFLAHHGVKGQKWGLRQYQYGDGSLTPKGRIHYGVGAARDTAKNAASKVTGAIRKKVAPNKQDLEEKYQKALAKKEKREIKEAIKEAEGKKKKTKDMTDQEVAEKLRRLENERRIKQLEDDRSTVKKVATGTGKVAVGGTVMALKGAAFVGKTAFNITKPLLNAGGQLAIDYVRKSGNKKIDDLLKDDSDRIREGWQNAKNLYEMAQYKEKLDNMSTTSYKEARKWSQAAEVAGYKKSVAESKKFIADNTLKPKSAADRIREDRKQMTRDNIDRLKLMATNGNKETREYAQNELTALRNSGAYQEIFGGNKKK